MGSRDARRSVFFLLFMGWVVFNFYGCGNKNINIRGMPSEDQFAYAKMLFDKKDYYKAKMQFNIIVMNNPGSAIIEKAQFYLAESYYYSKEYILAIEEYEKFIRSLPRSAFVDDAQYKIGMCYINLAPGYALDQEYTVKASAQFQRFLEEYPDSELKPEAEKRMYECREKLAKKEYKTGELYRKMGYYNSAIISYDAVIEKYYDTEFADDAQFWKGECYRKMWDWEHSEKAFSDLLSKYGESVWAKKAREKLHDVRMKKNSVPKEDSGGFHL